MANQGTLGADNVSVIFPSSSIPLAAQLLMSPLVNRE